MTTGAAPAALTTRNTLEAKRIRLLGFDERVSLGLATFSSDLRWDDYSTTTARERSRNGGEMEVLPSVLRGWRSVFDGYARRGSSIDEVFKIGSTPAKELVRAEPQGQQRIERAQTISQAFASDPMALASLLIKSQASSLSLPVGIQ